MVGEADLEFDSLTWLDLSLAHFRKVWETYTILKVQSCYLF
jgi:hypothetical protein